MENGLTKDELNNIEKFINDCKVNKILNNAHTESQTVRENEDEKEYCNCIDRDMPIQKDDKGRYCPQCGLSV